MGLFWFFVFVFFFLKIIQDKYWKHLST